MSDVRGRHPGRPTSDIDSATTTGRMPVTWNAMQEGPVKEEFVRRLGAFRKDVAAVTEEFHKVIIGQDDVLRQLLATIFSRGHCLLEGVPGLGKTMMVSTLARIMDLTFKRIQFTPDLMPTDITGTTVI